MALALASHELKRKEVHYMSDTATREPRADKVAVVKEIGERLAASQAVFVAEYRGLTVSQIANVRNALRPADAQLAVYKNTLATLAVREAGLDNLEPLLVGPTALTFVRGDVAGAAKALRESAKTMPALVVKGGVLGEAALSESDVLALADLPSREELLAKFAGALQAPLVKTAGLLQALPRNFAYGLSALIDTKAA
jgi:large subunit ribosomal protein L10